MSRIGSGPAINPAPDAAIAAVRAVGPVDLAPATQAPLATAAAPVSSSARDPGPVPVDHDRVATIRKAIQNGSYPLVPTKIADAMIAAGMLLRMPK